MKKSMLYTGIAYAAFGIACLCLPYCLNGKPKACSGALAAREPAPE